MQTRNFPTDNGYRVWLSKRDLDTLLGFYRGGNLERLLGLMLGLHGLRTEEIVAVERQHLRALNGDDGPHKLRIPVGKQHRRRETPVSAEVVQLANYVDARQDEPLLDYSTKALRDWIQDARAELAADDPTWEHVSMHDLRRTWATSTFYTLAYEGVPIAEELTMGWGGWKMTASGRQTFRENYLGPEPDWIAEQTMELLELPSSNV